MKKVFLFLSITLFLSTTAQAQDAEQTPMATNIKAAMEAEIRSEDERKRDRNRRPAETLDFFGITPDMKVLELIPGGGWYTKLLAPALREEGELHVSLSNQRFEDLMKEEGLDKVSVVEAKGVEVGQGDLPGLRSLSEFSFDGKGYDAVLTFRNLHNFDATGRDNMNKAVFKALKKGGIYGIVDHTRRHNEPHTLENRRRADPVVIIKELLDLGFEFAGSSDLHYRADDELRFEVGRKTVTGNTDRFTLLFRKPK